MRIGLIAPPWVPVAPPAYGGTEVVIDNLARGLARLGHEVVLFTVGESTCPVERRWLYDAAVEPMGEGSLEVVHALAAYAALEDVDVIHDHTTLGPLVADRAAPPGVPVVVTHHGPFTMVSRRILAQAAVRARIVAISHAQARGAGAVPICAVIHHGIDLDRYRPGPGGGGYLMFMGRMSPDKGVHRALRVARLAGRPLKIVTKMRDAAERAYYEERVRPMLGPDDEPPHELSLDERLDLLHLADALVNPIRWPEPFGLVMAEALACGVPVLTYPYGAAPEIVESGLTGFLCSDERDMVVAVGRLDGISRAVCRAEAQRRFSMDRMAADYARLYERLLTEEPVAVKQSQIGPAGGIAAVRDDTVLAR
jgi:glycosyltransferase involved in cell wall biosynthesis